MSKRAKKAAAVEEAAEFRSETVQAVCEAVAPMKDNHRKVGEEIRFYVDGKCVRTEHQFDPEKYGRYEIGKTYEIDTASEVVKNYPKAAAAGG